MKKRRSKTFLEEFGGVQVYTCCKVGLCNTDPDGSYVQNSLYGRKMYILPLCHERNALYTSNKFFY